MKEIYIRAIASELDCAPWQVENCVHLLDEGNTIPFISRYRKEKTGGLDDGEVAQIAHLRDQYNQMEKRKETILSVIEGLGALTPELRRSIEQCTVSTTLEDLYLPFRPKRRTRATAAREAGLEPLADKIYSFALTDPQAEAEAYVCEAAPDTAAVLSGARDILAEKFSEDASFRQTLRQHYSRRWIVSKLARGGADVESAPKYRSYYDYKESLQHIASHRLLAILRGQDEGVLSVKIDVSPEQLALRLYSDFTRGRRRPVKKVEEQVLLALQDGVERLMGPSITREVLAEAKRKADAESIKVFGQNLRQLLLSPPVGQKCTMAIDPGFRNGCKTVVLDAQGNLLHHTIVYPHPPQSQKVKAMVELTGMVEDYGVEAIAIGNGTASRETEAFVRRLDLPEGCKIYIVSEDGASIYSASDVAREEFPDHDVTVRGAVSIGRRLMDPLAELVKIDPKSLGVGQYQYDVDQNLLREELDNTVMSCVNSVGVNLNTASPYLLRYVSGIGPSLSEAIVDYRARKGKFSSRADLLGVPRLGAKTFEQCAAFLRIPGGTEPLDNSAVHPECYHIVQRMARDLGVSERELVGNEPLCGKLDAGRYVEGDFGLPTIQDILRELAKPGLDPRSGAQVFSFSDEVHDIEDLAEGMELPGIVTNITSFGAFVDIGIHEDGLIHVSRMRPFWKGRGPVDPTKVLSLHAHVRVRVDSVDLDRKRVGLSLLEKL